MLFCKSKILLIFGNFGHFSSLSCRSTPSGSNFRSTRRLYHILQLFWEVHRSSFLPYFSTLAEWCFNNIAFGSSFIFQNFHFLSSSIRKNWENIKVVDWACLFVVCYSPKSNWGSQFYCNELGSSDWFWFWQKPGRSRGKWNHWSLTNGDSICHRCSDWLVNSGDDIPIGKSDRPHILVVVVAYMQLLSARDALFFRNSETAKSLEIRKCNFINLICQNLTINKFHRLRVPPNPA